MSEERAETIAMLRNEFDRGIIDERERWMKAIADSATAWPASHEIGATWRGACADILRRMGIAQ